MHKIRKCLLIFCVYFSVTEVEGHVGAMVRHGEPICITKTERNSLHKLFIACENGDVMKGNDLNKTLQEKSSKILLKRATPWGIKAMASTWTSTHGTQIGILQLNLDGEHVVNIRDYHWNLISADLDLQPGVHPSSLTFASHMNSLHLILLYPRKSVSG